MTSLHNAGEPVAAMLESRLTVQTPASISPLTSPSEPLAEPLSVGGTLSDSPPEGAPPRSDSLMAIQAIELVSLFLINSKIIAVHY